MEKLAISAEKLGLNLGARELALFQTYYEELSDWNQRMNLTAITEYDKVQINHFLDSLTVVTVWQPSANKPNPRVIDIGSGAGVPGIPLKIIFPQIKLFLMDATNKKITFLNHLKQKLGLDDIEVINGRAEELAHQQYREIFDLVLARGLAPMPTLAELTIPFCKIGGKFVAYKKGDIKEEMDQAELEHARDQGDAEQDQRVRCGEQTFVGAERVLTGRREQVLVAIFPLAYAWSGLFDIILAGLRYESDLEQYRGHINDARAADAGRFSAADNAQPGLPANRVQLEVFYGAGGGQHAAFDAAPLEGRAG